MSNSKKSALKPYRKKTTSDSELREKLSRHEMGYINIVTCRWF